MQQQQQQVRFAQPVVESSGTGGYVPPPPPTLNGGLYTGKPFEQGAPWANVPVTPDAGFYNFGNLRGVASAPKAARYMVPGGGLRPGNNTPLLPAEFANGRIANLNAVCVPASAYADTSADDNMGFRAFAYL